MSGLNGVPGSGDTNRLGSRPPTAPIGGATGAAPGFAPDGFVRTAPRVRVGPPVRTGLDVKALGMAIGGGLLALGCAALIGSVMMGAPLLGAATLIVAPIVGVPAIPLLGIGIAKLLAKREAAKIGEA